MLEKLFYFNINYIQKRCSFRFQNFTSANCHYDTNSVNFKRKACTHIQTKLVRQLKL